MNITRKFYLLFEELKLRCSSNSKEFEHTIDTYFSGLGFNGSVLSVAVLRLASVCRVLLQWSLNLRCAVR